MLGRHDEALDLSARIVTRGVDRIANGNAAEEDHRPGLIFDSHYQASLSLKAIQNNQLVPLHSSNALIRGC